MIVKRPSHAHRRSVSVLAVAAMLGATLLSPLAALAQDEGDTTSRKQEPERPWYVEFQGGVSHAPKQTIRDGSGTQGRIEPHSDAKQIGFVLGAALGREFFDFLRAETAISYREQGVDRVSFSQPALGVDGEVSLFAWMNSVYVDLTPELIGVNLGVVPFIGIGVGLGEADFDVRTKNANELDIRGQEIVFAYQAMAGLRVRFTKNTSLSATYRYVGTTDAENTRARIDPDGPGGAAPSVAQDIEAEYDAHEAYLGLRFEF